MKKILLWLTLFILTFSLGYLYRKALFSAFSGIKKNLPQISGDFTKELENIKQIISEPLPLRGPSNEIEVQITREGIFQYTNLARAQNGLEELKLNHELNLAAEKKTDDMFQKKYFEHTSPEGLSAGDLARNYGYEFLAIGENLALGNYNGNSSLVDAWMASPGHRANILDKKFLDIGVAAKQGIFEGKKIYLAVQIFARPQALCEKPSGADKSKIEANQTELAKREAELFALKKDIENDNPKKFREEESKKIENYNTLVEKYNLLLEETKKLIDAYNFSVQKFNACAAGK